MRCSLCTLSFSISLNDDVDLLTFAGKPICPACQPCCATCGEWLDDRSLLDLGMRSKVAETAVGMGLAVMVREGDAKVMVYKHGACAAADILNMADGFEELAQAHRLTIYTAYNDAEWAHYFAEHGMVTA